MHTPHIIKLYGFGVNILVWGIGLIKDGKVKLQMNGGFYFQISRLLLVGWERIQTLSSAIYNQF